MRHQSTKKRQKIVIKELSAWGFHIDINKPLKDEIELVISGFKALKSTIAIKKAEWDDEHKKELSEEKINIDKQVANVEQILGKNDIDLHRTMVSKWIEYVKIAEQKVKKQKAA